MSGPSYHARTHLPGGTDPLPQVTGQWAYVSSSGAGTDPLIAPNGGTGTQTSPFNMDTTTFYTNDAAVFDITSSVIAGRTYNGIRLLAAGHYKLEMFAEPLWDASFPTGGDNVLYELVNVQFDPNSARTGGPSAQKLDVDIHNQLGVAVAFLLTVSSAPSLPLIFGIENHSNSSFHSDLRMYLEYRDSDVTILS